MKLKRLLWTMVAMSACGDAQHAGEKGALRFQFGLFGCFAVDAGGQTLAVGARTILVATDDATKSANTMTVRSETPSALALSSDGGVPLASADFAMACTLDKNGVCTGSQGGVALSPTAAGKTRLVFERAGALVDALTVTAAVPTSMILRNNETKSTTALSTTAAKPLTLQAVLKDSGGKELVATDSFTWSATGPLAVNADNHQSGLTVNPTDGGTGMGEVTARFGTIEAKATIEAKP